MIYFRYPLAVFLIVPLSFIIIYYIKPKRARNILLVASRLVITLIILLSIASPYTIVEKHGLTGSTDITIIADNTDSMRIFDTNISSEVYSYLNNRTSTNIDFISGTSSPIGDYIVKNIKSGGNILLISDGNNNYGRGLSEAINFARSLNGTVYLLGQEPIKKDMRVSIHSDAVAILDTPADFYVDVDATGKLEGDLEVSVDDIIVHKEHVTQSKRVQIKQSFNTPGSHKIKAEIFTNKEDEISQNNVFYRIVNVVQKPRILFISKRTSPLSQVLSQLYSVDISSDLADPATYNAVVIDDKSASEISNDYALLLSDYVANGGGLVVVGGNNAYNDYSKRPLFEQLIPVKPGGSPLTGKSAGVVLVVDISGSTGEFYGDEAKLGVEKGLAIQILNSFSDDDFIGVIAFNNAPHTVVPFARYIEKSGIEDAIARLRYGGTTHLSTALVAAENMLKNSEGGRNVIVISDGVVSDGDSALKAASSMKDNGITIYTVGVGGDTDENFMKSLATAGGGGYMKRDQTHGITLLFGEMKNKERKDGFPLSIINSGHFITRDITLNATVYGYNNVFAKQNAQTLVITANGNPVISAWRFGLGRVVSVAVDDGNSWAPALYNEENSKIISTITNYAIGSPQGLEIRVQDGEIGKPLQVFVYSDKEPELSFDGEQLHFSKEGERFYSADIIPNSTGFHDIGGFTIAVNEASEYREIGNNEFISKIIAAAGGRTYNASEIGLLIPDITNKNTGLVHETIDLKPIFLLAALLMYSIEVISRRMAEILRL